MWAPVTLDCLIYICRLHYLEIVIFKLTFLIKLTDLPKIVEFFTVNCIFMCRMLVYYIWVHQ